MTKDARKCRSRKRISQTAIRSLFFVYIEKFSTWKDVLVVAAFLVSLTQRPCTEKTQFTRQLSLFFLNVNDI
jgi:hypothetical protein